MEELTPEPVVEEDSGSVTIIIVVVLLVVLIALGVFVGLYLRKRHLNKKITQLNHRETSSAPVHDVTLKVIKQQPVDVADVYEGNLYSDEEDGYKKEKERASDQDVNESARVGLTKQYESITPDE